MPPKIAARGGSTALAPEANFRIISERDGSWSCSTREPTSDDALILEAMSNNSVAAASSPAGGNTPPCCVAYSSSERKARCSKPARPKRTFAAGVPMTARNSSAKVVAAGDILDSSTSHNSPGSSRKSCNERHVSFLGWRCSVTKPPIWYVWRTALPTAVGTFTSNIFLPLDTLLTGKGPAAFSTSMPTPSEKLTVSSSSNSSGSSSTHCTCNSVSLSLLALICATMAVLIASPVESRQVKDGPRSTKTAPQRPCTSVRMKATGDVAVRQHSLTRSAAASGIPITTITLNSCTRSRGNCPDSAVTWTPGLSSCICCTQACARFFPMSDVVR
mmetsp:Transcript_16886/g.28073  ORF Transcript_16886/g.28073 Transcript_16886/m.28073 type:complete len:331 (+) Transcript_16886:2324-3316(+)